MWLAPKRLPKNLKIQLPPAPRRKALEKTKWPQADYESERSAGLDLK